MLKVNEIFKSIQGESSYTGLPCTFVRLTGCHIRCTYCDTSYAFHEGHDQSIEEVLIRVREIGLSLVEITGGEPLIQKDAFTLASQLADAHTKVLVETSGTIDLSGLDKRIIKIMDIKCPGSGVSDKMFWPNLDLLTPIDEIKFVISDQYDFDWAHELVLMKKLNNVLFAPVYKKLPPKQLAEWILKDNLPVRMQLQVHKYIWSPGQRGV
ncbi:MAG: radical SAM protein [Chlamydiota bacterium]|nr:radical SAM protein [Chlamydiota bacterium]